MEEPEPIKHANDGRMSHEHSFQRKRKKSFGSGGNYCAQVQTGPDLSYGPPNKKNRHFRRQPSVLPSKFLLGGNYNDPLNLNSLGNSDNAETPKSSPVPVPAHRIGELPVFIPKNPDDPLGLQVDGVGTLQDMIAGVRADHKKPRGRTRRKSLRKRNDSECSVDTVQTETEADEDFSEDSGNEIELADTDAKEKPRTQQADTKAKDVQQVQDELELAVSTVALAFPSSSEAISVANISPQHDKDSGKNDLAAALESGDLDVGTQETKSPDIPPRPPSDYVPLSSSRQCSPFILSSYDDSSMSEMITLPFESPSITNYHCSQEYRNMEPFSPPPSQNWREPRKLVPRPPAPLYLNPHVPFPNVSNTESNSLRSIYRKRLRHRLDPIVSPVIPQPGMRRNRHHTHAQPNQNKNDSTAASASVTASSSPKASTSGGKYKPKDELFQYGNYNRYYGYRNGHCAEGVDVRLQAFRKEWIEGKDVLDVGCNIGHITLSVARDFNPRHIRGIDIDNYLIKIAKKNILHYNNSNSSSKDTSFPNSFSSIYGRIQTHPTLGILESNEGRDSVTFPYNVSFQHENYVLDSDGLLECVREEYDVILCLSLTKWIHLNFGDAGLKRFFRRGFRNLRPGGLYILEPQPWSSYKRKKKLTKTIEENAKNIRFFPEHFQDFLLRNVGFSSVQHVGMQDHHLKGFQRPLLVFTKGAPLLPHLSLQSHFPQILGQPPQAPNRSNVLPSSSTSNAESATNTQSQTSEESVPLSTSSN